MPAAPAMHSITAEARCSTAPGYRMTGQESARAPRAPQPAPLPKGSRAVVGAADRSQQPSWAHPVAMIMAAAGSRPSGIVGECSQSFSWRPLAAAFGQPAPRNGRRDSSVNRPGIIAQRNLSESAPLFRICQHLMRLMPVVAKTTVAHTNQTRRFHGLSSALLVRAIGQPFSLALEFSGIRAPG